MTLDPENPREPSPLPESDKPCSQQPQQKYKCPHCPSSFKWPENLKRHQRGHDELRRKFTCVVCAKSFARSDVLGRHTAVHAERNDKSNDNTERKRKRACHECARAREKCSRGDPCRRCSVKGKALCCVYPGEEGRGITIEWSGIGTGSSEGSGSGPGPDEYVKIRQSTAVQGQRRLQLPTPPVSPHEISHPYQSGQQNNSFVPLFNDETLSSRIEPVYSGAFGQLLGIPTKSGSRSTNQIGTLRRHPDLSFGPRGHDSPERTIESKPLGLPLYVHDTHNWVSGATHRIASFAMADQPETWEFSCNLENNEAVATYVADVDFLTQESLSRSLHAPLPRLVDLKAYEAIAETFKQLCQNGNQMRPFGVLAIPPDTNQHELFIRLYFEYFKHEVPGVGLGRHAELDKYTGSIPAH